MLTFWSPLPPLPDRSDLRLTSIDALSLLVLHHRKINKRHSLGEAATLQPYLYRRSPVVLTIFPTALSVESVCSTLSKKMPLGMGMLPSPCPGTVCREHPLV